MPGNVPAAAPTRRSRAACLSLPSAPDGRTRPNQITLAARIRASRPARAVPTILAARTDRPGRQDGPTGHLRRALRRHEASRGRNPAPASPNQKRGLRGPACAGRGPCCRRRSGNWNTRRIRRSARTSETRADGRGTGTRRRRLRRRHMLVGHRRESDTSRPSGLGCTGEAGQAVRPCRPARPQGHRRSGTSADRPSPPVVRRAVAAGVRPSGNGGPSGGAGAPGWPARPDGPPARSAAPPSGLPALRPRTRGSARVRTGRGRLSPAGPQGVRARPSMAEY